MRSLHDSHLIARSNEGLEGRTASPARNKLRGPPWKEPRFSYRMAQLRRKEWDRRPERGGGSNYLSSALHRSDRGAHEGTRLLRASQPGSSNIREDPTFTVVVYPT